MLRGELTSITIFGLTRKVTPKMSRWRCATKAGLELHLAQIAIFVNWEGAVKALSGVAHLGVEDGCVRFVKQLSLLLDIFTATKWAHTALIATTKAATELGLMGSRERQGLV